MPRARQIKPTFFKDPDLAELPLVARVLYEGLWCYADRRGRLREQQRYLKSEILPWEDVDVDELLGMLAKPRGKKPGHVVRYEVDGEKFIWIPMFLRHQRPHPKEPQSEIPPCPCEDAPNRDSVDPESRQMSILDRRRDRPGQALPSSSSSPSLPSGEDPPVAPRQAGGATVHPIRPPKRPKRNRPVGSLEERAKRDVDEVRLARAEGLYAWDREQRARHVERPDGTFGPAPPPTDDERLAWLARQFACTPEEAWDAVQNLRASLVKAGVAP